MGKKPSEVEPWERQPRETDPAWQAFKTYRDMGEERSLSKVAARLGKSTTLIANWSARHQWVSRVRAYSRWQEDIARKAREKAIKQQAERDVKQGIGLQTIGQAQLRRYQPRRVVDDETGEESFVTDEKMSAFDARMCLVDGSKLVKSGLGEPESRTAVDIGGLTWSDLARVIREKKEKKDDA